ncbi:P-loop containing nucleoside triphosphate hydrolase protein [Lophiotrema nucula]|uniref:P-loop containing nucleoside triphosphate hydrolase protein n=1 Tax=Lophiotrema nucula TaxID=690887 RepID=A0A6A5YNZ4_9PLEO|nr:P-loop containing nucleoside triphosphate hydrolase protein [Lophiotrema nucula]
MSLIKLFRGKNIPTQSSKAEPPTSDGQLFEATGSDPFETIGQTQNWNLLPSDSLIMVMGVTGSGKSYFINQLRPNSAAEGHGLQSETKVCQIVRTNIGATTVAMIDTPGFDDEEIDDAETLGIITRLLTTQFRLGIRLKGIIYLHRINDTRFSGSARRFLKVFQEVCGENAIPNIALVTTMWSKSPHQIYLQRDVQLQNNWWAQLISKGALIFQYDGSRAMAETIVGQLFRERDVVLKIQHQLSNEHHLLEQTSAGALVSSEIEERLTILDEEVRSIADDITEANKSGNREKAHQLNIQLQEQSSRRERQAMAREELKQDIDSDTGSEIERAVETKKSKGERWESRLQVFEAVVGQLIPPRATKTTDLEVLNCK